MKLTAYPFDPQTGDLLPVYRDAYLRGDLARPNTAAVDAYLKTNSHTADETLRRFYEMKQQGEQVRPVGWVQRQFDVMRPSASASGPLRCWWAAPCLAEPYLPAPTCPTPRIRLLKTSKP